MPGCADDVSGSLRSGFGRGYDSAAARLAGGGGFLFALARLFPPWVRWIAAASAVPLVIARPALAEGGDPSLARCAAIPADSDRLACYDALARDRAGPIFSGFGNGATGIFSTSGPATLVYESEDVILVLYLEDDTGRLVQNLHLGGRGEGRYPLPGPGRYRVQVDASGGWRIRVVESRP